MAEHPLPEQDAMTWGRFIEVAADASGGMEALRRRLGFSKASIESMRGSHTPMSPHDAKALLHVLGLSPEGEVSDQQGRPGARGRR